MAETIANIESRYQHKIPGGPNGYPEKGPDRPVDSGPGSGNQRGERARENTQKVTCLQLLTRIRELTLPEQGGNR